MADEISKNIIIQVTAQTDQLEQSITNLNQIINSLQVKQQQLIASGNQTSAAFQNNADKIDIFQKSLQNATEQLSSFQSALNNAAGSLQKSQALIGALIASKDKYSKMVGDSSKKVNELDAAIKTLSSAVQQHQTQTTKSSSAIDANTKSLAGNAQQATNAQSGIEDINTSLGQQQKAVDDNKASFDAHKLVLDHLKTSFDQIKDVSGEFGPSLQDASQGFNLMKSGLAVVKDGLYGVGDALKADGFDFLLQILQQVFNAFIQSSEGTKVLQGAISAIGVVVNKVKTLFNELLGGIINAVSHPIESIKQLGRMVEQNIINRFTAFGKILDGLIHLDFKKVADGAIQAVSGVTDATGKIAAAVKTATEEIAKTGTDIAQAYTYGFNTADQAVNKSQKNTTAKINTNIADLDRLKEKQKEVYGTMQSGPVRGADAKDSVTSDDDQTELSAPAISDAQKTSDALKKIENDRLVQQMKDDDATRARKLAKEKEAAQQLKDFELKTAGQVSSAAFSILQNSIKQQTDAKLAALENQKNSELSNSNLTSAQKIAIEAQLKKKEDTVKLKAFKEEQEAALAQAVINGALAITKATSQTGVLSPLVVPEIIAETAIEIAKIESQKPPAYASGGLHYSSDGRGGVLPGYSRTDNTNAFLRSGEGIVVSEAMRAPWARNLVSAINVGFGGRDFSITNPGRGYAVGGIFTDGGDANRYYNAPVNDQKNLSNSIAYQMINNFPPVYVDVKDINNQQNILAQTINRVNL